MFAIHLYQPFQGLQCFTPPNLKEKNPTIIFQGATARYVRSYHALNRTFGRPEFHPFGTSEMMVWKTYFLSNMAILGSYVGFQGCTYILHIIIYIEINICIHMMRVL